jgi:hypothetical protein
MTGFLIYEMACRTIPADLQLLVDVLFARPRLLDTNPLAPLLQDLSGICPGRIVHGGLLRRWIYQFLITTENNFKSNARFSSPNRTLREWRLIMKTKSLHIGTALVLGTLVLALAGAAIPAQAQTYTVLYDAPGAPGIGNPNGRATAQGRDGNL